jgi:hypothetical protein
MKMENFLMTLLLLGGSSLIFRMLTQGPGAALIATTSEWSLKRRNYTAVKFRAQRQAAKQ